jgi:hypothetical protein
MTDIELEDMIAEFDLLVARVQSLQNENDRLRVVLEDLLDDTEVEDFGEWFEDRLKQAYAALEVKPIGKAQ